MSINLLLCDGSLNIESKLSVKTWSQSRVIFFSCCTTVFMYSFYKYRLFIILTILLVNIEKYFLLFGAFDLGNGCLLSG